MTVMTGIVMATIDGSDTASWYLNIIAIISPICCVIYQFALAAKMDLVISKVATYINYIKYEYPRSNLLFETTYLSTFEI